MIQIGCRTLMSNLLFNICHEGNGVTLNEVLNTIEMTKERFNQIDAGESLITIAECSRLSCHYPKLFPLNVLMTFRDNDKMTIYHYYSGIGQMIPHTVISIANDFSAFPVGNNEGPFCGRKFREDVLLPALFSYLKVDICMDNVLGFPASFLNGAFKGLTQALGKKWTDKISFINGVSSDRILAQQYLDETL